MMKRSIDLFFISQSPVPCASLLIRIVQAACHPNGRPKEVSGHSLCLNNTASSCFMSHMRSSGDALHDSALPDRCKSCVRCEQRIAFFVCCLFVWVPN